MKSICLYFQVHQPFRLRTYRFFDIGHDNHYYDEFQNRDTVARVAESCYLPMNALLEELLTQHGEAFKLSFSISGVAIDQFEEYAPEVLESFRRLANTGKVEFLAETYDHSLSSLRSKEEFIRQVKRHEQRVQEVFGIKPETFRNTELLYSDGIGEMVAELGYKAILAEGAKHILGWKSPNFMYCNAINPKLKVLLRNFNLSDDIAFRFSERAWNEWPLTAGNFAGWLNNVDPEQELVNIFLDYETFGEYQKPETGIMEFMRSLPEEVLANTSFRFSLPREAARDLQPVSAIHVPYPSSWADEERDITAWLGNELQGQAADTLYALEPRVLASADKAIHRDWARLQASDHLYFMSTKWFSHGEVHKRFNPYPGPYEAFINFMNVLADFSLRLQDVAPPSTEKPKKKKTEGLRWSDIPSLDDKLVKNVLKKCGQQVWGPACAQATKAIREKLLRNVSASQRAEYQKLEQSYRDTPKPGALRSREAILQEIKKTGV